MNNTFEIYFGDLTPEAQGQFLEMLGVPISETNYDIFPIAEAQIGDSEEDEVNDNMNQWVKG